MKRERDVEGLIHELSNPIQRGRLAIRGEAAILLGSLGDDRAAGPLCKLLEDDDENVRVYAAIAIGRLRSSKASAVLRRLIRDRNAIVAYRAVEALGKMRAANAIPDLVGLLDSPDWRMRRLAAEALAEIGDQAAGSSVRAAAEREPGWKRRRPIARAARRLGA